MDINSLYLENIKDKKLNLELLPRLNFDSKHFLNKIYNIHNWDDLKDYYNKNKYLDKLTIDRLLICSWEVFYKNYKLYLNKIISIYEIYFNDKKNIEIKSILRRIPEKNIHQFIIGNK